MTGAAGAPSRRAVHLLGDHRLLVQAGRVVGKALRRGPQHVVGLRPALDLPQHTRLGHQLGARIAGSRSGTRRTRSGHPSIRPWRAIRWRAGSAPRARAADRRPGQPGLGGREVTALLGRPAPASSTPETRPCPVRSPPRRLVVVAARAVRARRLAARVGQLQVTQQRHVGLLRLPQLEMQRAQCQVGLRADRGAPASRGRAVPSRPHSAVRPSARTYARRSAGFDVRATQVMHLTMALGFGAAAHQLERQQHRAGRRGIVRQRRLPARSRGPAHRLPPARRGRMPSGRRARAGWSRLADSEHLLASWAAACRLSGARCRKRGITEISPERSATGVSRQQGVQRLGELAEAVHRREDLHLRAQRIHRLGSASRQGAPPPAPGRRACMQRDVDRAPEQLSSLRVRCAASRMIW
jgi:hypothetical protein